MSATRVRPPVAASALSTVSGAHAPTANNRAMAPRPMKNLSLVGDMSQLAASKNQAVKAASVG